MEVTCRKFLSPYEVFFWGGGVMVYDAVFPRITMKGNIPFSFIGGTVRFAELSPRL